MQHPPRVERAVLAPRNIHLISPPPHPKVWEAEIIVGVSLHNQSQTLNRCLSSIFAQTGLSSPLAIMVLDDMSKDTWQAALATYIGRPELLVFSGNCGSAARSRNAILDMVDRIFLSARWVARMDADDRFSTPHSLAAACNKGDEAKADFVLGGNRLISNGEILEKVNPATDELLDAPYVLNLLQRMSEGSATNELPSCNLLLKARTGWRYPDCGSAEDHWLVADLLLNHAQRGAILKGQFYADYSLDGCLSTTNRQTEKYIRRRRRLFDTARRWIEAHACPYEYLGHGQEGVVLRHGQQIEKRFYPGALADEKAAWLRDTLSSGGPHLPQAHWELTGKQWICRYRDNGSLPANSFTLDQAAGFLAFCLRRNIVCRNIKRTNFRIDPSGNLMMIDVGNDIIPMDASVFRDSAARLYVITALNWPDAELARRKSFDRQEEILARLPGFSEFYAGLLQRHAEYIWAEAQGYSAIQLQSADDVTLLIKACAMDAGFLAAQVQHIRSLLSRPREFHEVILLIDPYEGPFLRQHCSGDISSLKDTAQKLLDTSIIDRVLVAPNNENEVREINFRWFGLDCSLTHNVKGVPVTPQIWAFDQISTRYVLQCDVDVLIGRRDQVHDFLQEMLDAASTPNVTGLAFNIPQPEGLLVSYDAPKGAYVPEVRCGLLDLDRIESCRPLPNTVEDGHLALTWYRSLEQYQQQHGLRTLRGGDARTFYIHPPNTTKSEPACIERARDLIGQGFVPEIQQGAWDLTENLEEWAYPRRNEDIVFLLKGRDTPTSKVLRCLASLRAQDDQDFGIILIDDASQIVDPTQLPILLNELRPQTTLIRRSENFGRMPNICEAISEICTIPETLIVVLDLDDALMARSAVGRLRQAHAQGHDVILANCFQPDKPLKIYAPNFSAPRETWGGEVWPHLRSFQKRLFDAVPESYFKIDDRWIEECTDYATMVPIVELSVNPVFIPEYIYFHERSTPRTPESRTRKNEIIRRILIKPSLRKP